MASNRKLSIIFEADSREAVRGIRSIYGELERLKSLSTSVRESLSSDSRIFGQSGIDAAISSSDTFLNRLQRTQGLLNDISRSNTLNVAVSGLTSQLNVFNKGLETSRRNIANVQSEIKRNISSLEKNIQIKIKAEQPKTQEAKQRYDDRLNKTIQKRIELEHREIKQAAARRKQVEVEKAQRVKSNRATKAESIIQGLSTPNSAFRSDSMASFQPRKFASESYIRKEIQKIERREANKGRAESNFGTANRNNIDDLRRESTQQLGKLFNERIRLHKEESEQRKKEERERIEAVKRQQLKNEEDKRRQILNATKRGLLYSGEGYNGRGGISFGASRLGKQDGRRNVTNNSLGSAVREFALDSAMFRLPTNAMNIVEGARSLTGALGSANLAGVALASTISVGIVGGMVLAEKAVVEFGRQLEVAKKDQLALIGISTEVQRLFNVSRQDADSFYESVQVQTEIAARDTSVETSDIASLNRMATSAYLTTFKDTGKTLEEISKQMVDTNTRFAILGQSTPGVTPFQIRNAYISALGGQLEQAMKRQEFFRNIGFGDVIREVAREQQVDLAQATRIQQVEIFEEALRRRVPQSLIDRAQNESIEAQLSSFQDKLFAQRTGIFGIQRDLDLGTAGNQSVFTEVTRTFELIFGTDGLFSQLGRILGGTGLDIMAGIRNGLRLVNTLLTGVNMFLSGLAKLMEIVANTPVFPGLNLGQVGRGLFNVATLGAFSSGYAGSTPESQPQLSSMELAVSKENKYKPPNSNLVIANSSEYIFPNKKAVLDYAAKSKVTLENQQPKNYNLQPGSIVVNASPNQSPQQIARAVIDEINREFSYKVNLKMG